MILIMLVKDGRVVTLKCKDSQTQSKKPHSMIDAQFYEKNEIV